MGKYQKVHLAYANFCLRHVYQVAHFFRVFSFAYMTLLFIMQSDFRLQKIVSL